MLKPNHHESIPCLPARPPRSPPCSRSRVRSNPTQSPTCAPYLDSVPDPRSRRGRWYSLTAILLVCACATVSGARSIDELAEWGARAGAEILEAVGIRRHLLCWRRFPSRATIGRALERLDGDALDQAIGSYPADRHHALTDPTGPGRPQRIIAVDGKALKGSARLDQRHRHLLSALTHRLPVTVAQAEVGATTNETAHCKPLLAPLGWAGDVITFDALHTVQDHATWLVKAKQAHYIAVIKTNQPTTHTQISALPWSQLPVAPTASENGHGRTESRSINTMAVANNLGGIAFPEAELAIRVRPRRKESGQSETRETVFPVTSLDAHQATPAVLAAWIRGHWSIENSSPHIRDVTFGEDASTVHAGTAPRAMAAFRNLAIGALKTLGAVNIATTTRAIREEPERALPILGTHHHPNPSGT
ncbi:ISAs1 family transposase [Glycomyces sp. TRM65418]|uniref:ISAs1 family transposase n=1 Tax=Glycomyces sp. TRM65418 TaxID=2867006 RepID=UPI001CE65916|nr:ISAs1 family transposase [Glycomyces sp. TRM65418]MCC3764508.1 ISAs1 family transposase [Glycomyces sp. TRM65418]QZD54178.1 ISAs1 family transposase [Glycomyces sp. TRM65418]